MRYADVVSRLEAAFVRPLPGAEAHERLAPRPRRNWPAGMDPARIRNAAGLLLVFADRGENVTHTPPDAADAAAHVVLTLRSDSVRHGGQVSLPGGVVDPGETIEQAALREATEEIALDPDGLRVLGALTPLDIPVSGFRLHPIVAVLDRRPTLEPHDREVAAILDVDLGDLARPSTLVERSRMRDGVAMAIPAFHVANLDVWGATAMVLAEFLVLLGWPAAAAS